MNPFQNIICAQLGHADDVVRRVTSLKLATRGACLLFSPFHLAHLCVNWFPIFLHRKLSKLNRALSRRMASRKIPINICGPSNFHQHYRGKRGFRARALLRVDACRTTEHFCQSTLPKPSSVPASGDLGASIASSCSRCRRNCTQMEPSTRPVLDHKSKLSAFARPCLSALRPRLPPIDCPRSKPGLCAAGCEAQGPS